MLPSVNNAVISQGLAKLTDAFRNKANVKATLRALLWSFQDAESAVWALIDALQNPTGDLLTRRARMVGEERNGRSDADLLAAYKLRILVNRSQGRAEDILQVANALCVASYFDGAVPASWFVEASNPNPPPNVLAGLLGEAKDGGTYGVLSYSVWDSAGDFEWSDEGGSTVPGLGWSDLPGGGYDGGLLYSLKVTA